VPAGTAFILLSTSQSSLLISTGKNTCTKPLQWDTAKRVLSRNIQLGTFVRA
jgi:hypothetical protein